MKKNKVGRPKTRTIDDSKRPVSEWGLALDEKRYLVVLKKQTIETAKSIAGTQKKKIKEVFEEGIKLLSKKYKL